MEQTVVLVVEDEPTLREMIQLMVEDLFGVETMPAENGTEALHLARKHQPALMLLDIMLPGIDGLEVAKRLRADPATRHIPIIAITAASSRQAALAAGCNDYLAKPFDIDMLSTKIRTFLKGIRPLAHC